MKIYDNVTVWQSPLTRQPAPGNRGGAALQARPCGRAKGHVLLIESDAAISDLVATVLEDEGYAVEWATTPRDALAALALRGPAGFDLVLSVPFTDPLHDPYAWLDHLRTRTGRPVVICARCPALFYPDHRRRGYAAFLEEPFELQQLIDLVAALCPGPATPTMLAAREADDG